MSKPIPKSYKWELIMLLWVAFFLNQGDRQIFNSVLPLIRENLGLSDLQLGLVATIFTFLYGILVPIAGFAGDAFQKRWIVMLSLATFSVGTLFTGYANGLILLIIFRSIATGAGEAFYYPAANSMIGQYHTKSRAQAMALHQTANYTGVVVSGFLAAWIGENYGWRMAFYTFGFFGVIWVIIVFSRFRNDKADAALEKSTQETDSAVDKITLREALRATFTKPTLGLLSLAFGGMVFVHIGYVTWMPTFLYEKYDMKLSSAGLNSMLYHHLLAYVGVLLAGRISDKLSAKYRKARMWIEFIGLLLGFPFIVWMGATESLVLCYVALAGFGFFRGMYDSNLFAAMFDVIDPKYRASATGIMVSCAFIVGALSPVILGWVKQNFTLGQGISALGLIYLFSAILVLIAIKWTFDSDFVGDA